MTFIVVVFWLHHFGLGAWQCFEVLLTLYSEVNPGDTQGAKIKFALSLLSVL